MKVMGGGLLNFPGVFTGEGMPRFKNSGVLKTAKPGDFEMMHRLYCVPVYHRKCATLL